MHIQLLLSILRSNIYYKYDPPNYNTIVVPSVVLVAKNSTNFFIYP